MNHVAHPLRSAGMSTSSPETSLKFYNSVAKRLKLKVRKVLGLIHTFVEVTGEELLGEGGGAFWSPHPE